MELATQRRGAEEQKKQREYMTKAKREEIKRAFVEACKIYADKAPADNILFMQGFIMGITGKSWKEIEKLIDGRGK